MISHLLQNYTFSYCRISFYEFSVFKYLNNLRNTVIIIVCYFGHCLEDRKRQILCCLRFNRGPAFSKDRINLKPTFTVLWDRKLCFIHLCFSGARVVPGTE